MYVYVQTYKPATTTPFYTNNKDQYYNETCVHFDNTKAVDNLNEFNIHNS